MSEKVLEIKGFEELLDGLKKAPELARPLLEDAMTESLSALHDALAEYPAATEANQPGRMDELGRPVGYYERGRGWWYPVYGEQTVAQAVRAAGGKNGKRAGIIKTKKAAMAGYKLRRSSENLGKKWTSQVSSNDTGVLGQIGTAVSYADWVQGAQQADFHAARDWKTVSQVLEAALPVIEKNFAKAVDKLIEKLGK